MKLSKKEETTIIYFDNSATTLIHPQVLETYREVATKIFGNPSSLHALGTTATRLLDASRRQIAELLGLSADEIYFTSGGTEGDNWVLKGLAFEKQRRGKHILVSAIEHPAVKNAADWLATQGFEIEYIPVTRAGFVDVAALAERLREDTILVSVMAVNNEIGSIQPLAAIAELLAERPSVSFHVDAVQAVGKIAPVDWLLPRVDFATLSAHKFHGPRGVGILVKQRGKRLMPLLHGGGQESAQRSTTENLPGIAATAKALRLALTDDAMKREHVRQLKRALYTELTAYDDVILFSQMDDFAPNILTFGLKGIRGEVLVHALEAHEIYVSTTSACSSKKNAAAGTLVAMKVPSADATTAVRISLDASNTAAEVALFLSTFHQIYQQIRRG